MTCSIFPSSEDKSPQLGKKQMYRQIIRRVIPQLSQTIAPFIFWQSHGKDCTIVHKHVFNFCRYNSILTAMQSGFVPGDSTVNQLVDLYNTSCKALEEGKETRTVFCDINKAFERVWHRDFIS